MDELVFPPCSNTEREPLRSIESHPTDGPVTARTPPSPGISLDLSSQPT